MKLSYEGIGQWAATFAASDVAEGELVKISANGTVAACTKGDPFCGMVLSVSRGGDACAVALGGLVTAGYTETAPAASRWTRVAGAIWWWTWTPTPKPLRLHCKEENTWLITTKI